MKSKEREQRKRAKKESKERGADQSINHTNQLCSTQSTKEGEEMEGRVCVGCDDAGSERGWKMKMMPKGAGEPTNKRKGGGKPFFFFLSCLQGLARKSQIRKQSKASEETETTRHETSQRSKGNPIKSRLWVGGWFLVGFGRKAVG